MFEKSKGLGLVPTWLGFKSKNLVYQLTHQQKAELELIRDRHNNLLRDIKAMGTRNKLMNKITKVYSHGLETIKEDDEKLGDM